MREGSYTQIEIGMEVVGSDGDTIGGVDEVIVDEASGIFVGLAVKRDRNAHPLFVPGELVDRLHDEIVYVNARTEDLDLYYSPEERHEMTERQYQS